MAIPNTGAAARRRHGRALASAAMLTGMMAAAQARPVLMISIDGMKPEYVTQADAHGLKIPFLRGMLAAGAFAQGVEGVWPTKTYPSHTTLLTGVTPAEHGIYNNLEFDPRRKFAEAWFWYAHQVRVPTLWQAAHRAGLVTASVSWPVSVGATQVDYLIPEYWRVFNPAVDSNPSDRNLIADLSRPEGMLRSLEEKLGPYLMGNDVSLDADETRTRFAVALLREHRPTFMTVHLSSLDEAEHDHNPFSDEADQDLEAIDGMLSRLFAAARANDPRSIEVVVSDHGFTPLTHRVNLSIPFVEAGLIDAPPDPDSHLPVIRAWKAQPWLASGMAAVMLHDPNDSQVREQVRRLLTKLAADPECGIAEILEPAAIRARGAFPDAAFLIVMRTGYDAGGNLAGPLVTGVSGHGDHGFSPQSAEMRAAFFAVGEGVARHRDLGVIDMRRIAPTIAQFLEVPLPSAKAPPLPVSD
jgi:predicted AlkP superfamily pyrophosphatase or phosphodiesterase